ncbi:phytanoyl-CoA dioxygenase family protein [Micromonospora sp. NPDC007271]|uniref:phytanoyl-CoA dioxygenase family protein n=1 Tax=Micromonospora sp. NPDC007271 TaxID=3154587 RepID=UPI0034042A9F
MEINTVRAGRVSLDDLTVHGPDVDATVSNLERHGVAVLPGWLSPDRVAAVAAEFDSAFATVDAEPEELTDTGKDLSRAYGRTSTGEHLKYGLAELAESQPATYETFRHPFMRAVADGYLGVPNTVNRHVVLTNDYRPGDEVIGYHFDEIRSLKFLVYLDDVDETNGAFEIIPGTQHQGAQVRTSEWLRTGDYNSIRIRVFDSFTDDLFYTLFGHFKPFLALRGVPVHAPAGTMIAFTTDTIHRAGQLQPGRSRRVARAHSYSGLWP